MGGLWEPTLYVAESLMSSRRRKALVPAGRTHYPKRLRRLSTNVNIIDFQFPSQRHSTNHLFPTMIDKRGEGRAKVGTCEAPRQVPNLVSASRPLLSWTLPSSRFGTDSGTASLPLPDRPRQAHSTCTPPYLSLPANRNVSCSRVSIILDKLSFPGPLCPVTARTSRSPIPDCWIGLEPSEHSLRLPSAFVDRIVASGDHTALPTDGSTQHGLAGDAGVEQWTENTAVPSRTMGSPERIPSDIAAAMPPPHWSKRSNILFFPYAYLIGHHLSPSSSSFSRLCV